MKKLGTKILSVVLCIACIYGLVAGTSALKDVNADKAYWENNGKEASANFDRLADGISQLSENEDAYVAGVDDYEKGTKDYDDGLAKYEAG
ncbi:MAG: hypothetical protein Q3985_04610, partial [Eubacteriales bacterium]|nr:hypothetical protein [Eubacteriales bacterium]